jgi:D-threo-aldose 1-dehydrogenase
MVQFHHKGPIGKTGLSVGPFGFGGAPIGDLKRAESDADVQKLLAGLWNAGIRYFDTAPLYGFGLSERRLGDFLRDRPRADYVLSTKVGRLLEPDRQAEPSRHMPFKVAYDYSHDGVMRSFEASLQRLGLASVDMLLLHDLGRQTHGERHPEMLRQALEGGGRALAELKAAGVVKAIGLGVNEWQICEEIAGYLDLDLFLLAGRYTLLDQSAVESFLPMCRRRNIAVVVGSVFHRGVLATGAVPGALEYGKPAPDEVLAAVRRMEEICRAHGVSLRAAALHFPLLEPAVTTVIPGHSRYAEFVENLPLLTAEIPTALWADLKHAGLIRPDAVTEH